MFVWEWRVPSTCRSSVSFFHQPSSGNSLTEATRFPPPSPSDVFCHFEGHVRADRVFNPTEERQRLVFLRVRLSRTSYPHRSKPTCTSSPTPISSSEGGRREGERERGRREGRKGGRKRGAEMPMVSWGRQEIKVQSIFV